MARTKKAEKADPISGLPLWAQKLAEKDYAKVLPRDPGRALQILENYLRMRLSDNKSLALIIDFAETLAPGSEIGSLSSEDRYVLATLIKWAQDPQFLAGDVSIILIAEN